MKYNSIREYFYKLSNRCLALALLPVIIVWAAYLTKQYFYSGLPWRTLNDDALIWLAGEEVGVMVIALWTLGRMVKVRLAIIKMEPSLGTRIKDYIVIVMIRFRLLSGMLMIIGITVFLTEGLIFLYLLLIPFAANVIYWPTRYRLAKDLKLKPEERLVLKNKNLGV